MMFKLIKRQVKQNETRNGLLPHASRAVASATIQTAIIHSFAQTQMHVLRYTWQHRMSLAYTVLIRWFYIEHSLSLSFSEAIAHRHFAASQSCRNIARAPQSPQASTGDLLRHLTHLTAMTARPLQPWFSFVQHVEPMHRCKSHLCTLQHGVSE